MSTESFVFLENRPNGTLSIPVLPQIHKSLKMPDVVPSSDFFQYWYSYFSTTSSKISFIKAFVDKFSAIEDFSCIRFVILFVALEIFLVWNAKKAIICDFFHDCLFFSMTMDVISPNKISIDISWLAEQEFLGLLSLGITALASRWYKIPRTC